MFQLFILALIAFANSQTLMESIFQFGRESAEHAEAEPDDAHLLLNEYDFIVVGAGTAGNVVVNRLTENSSWNVLLLEAGGSEEYNMDIPFLAKSFQSGPDNWDYESISSNNYCLGMDNNRCKIPRGKVIGGSSVLNYMLYIRGNRKDYDHWAELGNTGWSFDEVLPYFKKIENFHISEFKNSQYHSKGGNVNVGYAPYHTKIAEAAVQAEIQNGASYIDYNGATQIGVSYFQTSMNNGVRDSSSRTYLHPIKDRANFHLRKKSIVTKILINPSTLQAYGVEFEHLGNRYTIHVTKEVILSAGVINSPQLLMLSGIGPQDHLEEIGIDVLQDLPVGENLMDHVFLGGVTFLINSSLAIDNNVISNSNTLIEYFSNHTGPLSSSGGSEVVSFYDTTDPNNPDGHPDIEILYTGVPVQTWQTDFGIRSDFYNEVFAPIAEEDAFLVCPVLLRPKSKGKITLIDNNYLSKPLIDLNYFNDTDDLDVLVKGVKLLLNITQQPAFQSIGTILYSKLMPGCEDNNFGTDDYWKCVARLLSLTLYHQAGTCKMGANDDQTAVVDQTLKVYGINGLRVIDASIIPMIPSAHTNAPTFMIAEKGSDMIKADWR